MRFLDDQDATLDTAIKIPPTLKVWFNGATVICQHHMRDVIPFEKHVFARSP